jgi:hypothetical protein
MADGEQEPSPNQQYRDRDAYFEGCHGGDPKRGAERPSNNASLILTAD